MRLELKYFLTRIFFLHFVLPGKCLVDYTEKGWFITYIDRDPETIRKQEAVKAKEKMDATDDERVFKFIEKQIERAKDAGASREVEFTDLNREDEAEKITFSLGAVQKVEPVLKNPELVLF